MSATEYGLLREPCHGFPRIAVLSVSTDATPNEERRSVTLDVFLFSDSEIPGIKRLMIEDINVVIAINEHRRTSVALPRSQARASAMIADLTTSSSSTACRTFGRPTRREIKTTEPPTPRNVVVNGIGENHAPGVSLHFPTTSSTDAPGARVKPQLTVECGCWDGVCQMHEESDAADCTCWDGSCRKHPDT